MRLLHPEDGRFLDLCVQGDEKAWRELVQSYSGFVAATVRRVFERARGHEGHHHEVEEMVCDFFGDLWMRRAETLGRFRGECTLRGFLAVLAANCARRRVMSIQRVNQVATRLQGAAMEVMETRPREMELHVERTASAVELCAGHEKRLFRLLYVEEVSVDQACAVLGISRDTLYLRKHRFLHRVRGLLQVFATTHERRPELTALRARARSRVCRSAPCLNCGR